MSIGIRPMKPGEEDAIAAMIRQLPRDAGLDVQLKITGETLRKAADILRVTVANNAGLLVGACVWMPTFSTWRGARGAYVCDLFVMAHARGRKIGERLLVGVAREAAAIGATYMRLELGVDNPRAEAFYERLGFREGDVGAQMFLEQAGFEKLLKG